MEEYWQNGKEEGRNEGRNEGRKLGRNEGINEEKQMIALRMLETGKYALEEIANISGLSVDKIKELSESRPA